MISLFRIDCRLIHYQTAQLWPKKLNINMILVAADDVLQDKTRMGMFKVMVPKAMKLMIGTVQEAIDFLNSSEADNYKIELIVGRSEDALAITQQVPAAKKVQAAIIQQPDGKNMTSFLKVNAADKDNFKAMLDAQVTVEYCVMPTEKPVSVARFL